MITPHDPDEEAELTARELSHSEWSKAELIVMDARFCAAMAARGHLYAEPADTPAAAPAPPLIPAMAARALPSPPIRSNPQAWAD